ncbi:LuxR C-terminal-related transcriptional regulator [Sanguibacter massiliensis]|uniref:LuxR C-terminal-related transcriptional regulator n=1 Tax=Sanguibacter massiliensis TaxID=1973217 RepID=UPI00101AE285|nr:LuxR C-terminal-related transcriptional regulator [Sanguibacter massiliensis]
MTIGVPVRADTAHHPAARSNYRGLPRTQSSRIPQARALSGVGGPEPLTIVRAPHGFGKSTLAAQWLRALQEEGPDVVWLGADIVPVLHEEPVAAFWTQFVARLVEVTPGSATPHGPVGPDDALRLLLSRDRAVVVVVDRLEQVPGAGHALESALLDLVKAAEQLHLIVCAREVGLLEVVGSATVDARVLRPADLALTAEDVAALAAQQGLPLGREAAAQLVEDTGGWPALVRVVLAGTAVAHHGGDEVTIDLDAGRWFLRAAWDEFATPGLPDLVLRTSLLAEFTAEQAGALCPGIDVKAGISALQGAGLVRTRLVAGTAVHSHLTAVRRECVQRLRTEQPDLFGELSRTVARELLADGRTGAAVVHLVRARLWDELVESVETGWRALVGYGEHELLGLLERLPAEVVARSARLVVLRDYVAVRSSSPDVPGAAPSSPGSLAPLLRRIYEVSGAEPTVWAQDPTVRYRDLAPTVRRGLALVLCEWATDRLVAGDSSVAHVAFADAHLLADELGDVRLRTRAAVGAALVDVVHGEILSAARWLETLDADARTVLDAEPALATFAAATRALVAIGRLDLRSPDLEGLLGAEAVVDEARGLVETVRLLASLVRGERDSVAEGDEPPSARHVPGDPDDLVGTIATSARIDLLLAQGRIFQARSLLARAAGPGPSFILTRARTAYHGGDFARAVVLARQGLAIEPSVPRLQTGMLLVLAAAESARGHEAEATAAARDALAACTASGLVQYLAYTPREVLRGLSADVPGLADALDDLESRGVGDILPAPRVVAELSEREREVLETLATSDSLGAVARRLYLTTNTVKTHLRSIYRKLGTHSAAETVQRAVECGLIEPPQD